MQLLELFRTESTVPRRKLLILIVVAGISNALILAVINQAAQQTKDSGGANGGSFPYFASQAAQQVSNSGENSSYRYLLLFILVVLAYVLSQRYVLVTSTIEINNILHHIQVRIADKVRRCQLQTLDGIGRAKIFSSTSRDLQTIAQTGPILIFALQSAVLIFFTVIYVAFLSLVAVTVCAVFTGIAVSFHLRRLKQIVKDMHEVDTRENTLFDMVTHFLDGFKEVKMNARRSDDLLAGYSDMSAGVRDLRTRTYHQISHYLIYSQTTFYILMALMVFVVPRFSAGYSNEDVIKGTAAILFLIGPVSGLMNTLPAFTNANVAAENIAALESDLDQAAGKGVDRGRKPKEFKEIRFEGVTFSFEDPRTERPFTVGPLDLTISQGEMLFIAGGNGTGKSTLLKLLTSLYSPQKGTIRINGTPLTRVNHQAYRELFSTVFSDYHLFDRLYGLLDVDPERVRDLLELFEIADKTDVIDGKFETLDLSGGQRKRLAMIVSLLEDRPILIFDEVAADQDPVFRKDLYEVLLRDLKKQGKTVILVTHDDRYFGVADRLLKMEDGRFVSTELYEEGEA